MQLDGVRALNVAGNFTFDAATHPDFLGACLGTGTQLQVYTLHPGSCSIADESQSCMASCDPVSYRHALGKLAGSMHVQWTSWQDAELGYDAGIDRGRVGDVLINGEKGAHILVAADLVQYLEDNLTQASCCQPLHTSALWQACCPAL